MINQYHLLKNYVFMINTIALMKLKYLERLITVF